MRWVCVGTRVRLGERLCCKLLFLDEIDFQFFWLTRIENAEVLSRPAIHLFCSRLIRHVLLCR